MLHVERHETVALVRFERGEKLNAFNQQLIRELTRCAQNLQEDRATQAVVLTGSAQAFSSGMDLADEMWNDAGRDDLERREMYYGGVRMCEAWERLPQVSIAAIEGMAVGGGVALSLACDWRVMASDAFLYVPEVKAGINLQWGALPRLISLVGPARAKRICLLCEKFTAQQAFDWGLADALAAPGGAVAEALQLAAAAVRQPAVTVRMVKEAINATAGALHRVASFADADQSQLSAGFGAARAARESYRDR